MLTITTANNLDGYEVVEYLGIVTGEAVSGINMFRDIGAGLRNVFGGRSAGYEDEMAQAREEVLRRLLFVRFPISGQNTLIVRRPCSLPPTKPLDSFERLRDVLDGCPHAGHAPEAHPCATCGFIKPTTIQVFDHVAVRRTINPF